MGVSEIFDYVDKYGIGGVIIVVLLLLLVTLFKTEWFSNLLSKSIDKLFKKRAKIRK